MHAHSNRPCLLAVAVVLTLGGWAGAADRGDGLPSVSMTVGPHRSPVVDVQVNGRPFRMIVDTGSTHTSITSAAAEALGAVFVAKSSVQTAAGERLFPIARLDRLTLGGRAFKDVLATVLASEELDPSGLASGVIGQDVLAGAAYTLDFASRRFLWQPDAGSLQGSVSVGLEAQSGRFVAAIPHAGTMLRLVPDSGAEALVLFGAAARRRWQPVNADTAWIDTVTGRTPAALAVLPRFDIAGRTLRNVSAAFLPERVGSAAALDGLLPLSLFSRVTIDGPGRRLLLTP